MILMCDSVFLNGNTITRKGVKMKIEEIRKAYGLDRVEEIEEMEPEICPACHGCGEYQTASRWRTCPSCGGSGELKIDEPLDY